MTTMADRQLNDAAMAVNTAIQELSVVVVDRCDGHADYKAEYAKALRQALNMLMDVRDLLNR